MSQLADEFRLPLRRYSLPDLRAHSGTIYGLFSDLRLAYLNPAWFRFAAENGGEPRISEEWTLGRSILDSIPSPLRDFYERHFHECLRTATVWKHEYECSSAARYRRFHQIVYPLDDGTGLLVVNSLLVDRPHDPAERLPYAPDQRTYQDADGLICQCAHCRRVKHPGELERWDWIPEWVTGFPKATSHGFCPTCFRFYYPVGADAGR